MPFLVINFAAIVAATVTASYRVVVTRAAMLFINVPLSASTLGIAPAFNWRQQLLGIPRTLVAAACIVAGLIAAIAYAVGMVYVVAAGTSERSRTSVNDDAPGHRSLSHSSA